MIKNSILVLAVMILAVFQSCKKDRSTVFVNNTGNTNNPVQSFPVEIFKTFSDAAPKRQNFSININNGAWVVGKAGSRFFFPANSLLDKSGNPVSGTVNIELIEYMNIADMLFSGVTVTSGSKLLESGGMFYLMARQNNEELKLKTGSGFRIKIPQSNKTDDPMDFWTGENNPIDSLNQVNWELEDTVAIVPNNDSGMMTKYYDLNFNYFKFGYGNVDRDFSKFKSLVKKFRIKMPEGCNDTNSTALLMFKEYNSCAWCGWISAEKLIATPYSLPSGETIKILIYKKTGKGEDDLEYAVKEVLLNDENLIEFDTTVKCTGQQLEDIIKAL